jgi:apolipoprotein N-acyltransferase
MGLNNNYSVIRRFRHVLLSIASGLILAVALPKPGTWLAAWIGLVPLLLAVRGTSFWRASLYGLITGLVYYGIILHWITLFGALPWVLLIGYQALYFAVFAALYVRLQPSRIGWLGYAAAPAAWVVLQFLRTLGAYAFIWGSFAHTQAGNLLVAQIASVTGPWGIDFLVAFVNVAFAASLLGPARRMAPLAVASLLTIAVCVFGLVTLNAKPPAGQTKTVAIVQGAMKNVFEAGPLYVTRAFSTYTTLTLQAADKHPDVILWPETTLPTDLSTPFWGNALGLLSCASRAELLVGGYITDPTTGRGYNALFCCNARVREGTYRKVRLVPFGEFVPLRDLLPFAKNYGVRPDDVLAAKEHVLLNSRLGKLGVSICFESLFPQIARTETLSGARVLCVVTNDSWFERTQAGREHLMMAQLRAIENRRFVLRAAETGISAVIDPFGRIRSQLGLFRQGIITDKVQPSSRLTVYSRWGDWFAYASIAIMLLGVILSARSPRAGSRGKPRRET